MYNILHSSSMGEMLEPVTEQLYSEHKLYLSQVVNKYKKVCFRISKILFFRLKMFLMNRSLPGQYLNF